MPYQQYISGRECFLTTPPFYASGSDLLSKIPFGFIDIRFSSEKLSMTKILWLGFHGTYILI